MNSKFVLLAIVCLAGLLACPAYAGVTINGTTITFSDNSMQATANPPSDHGGTGNTVNGTDSFIGGGNGNLVTDDYSTIGGGQGNQAGDNAGTTSDRRWATVGGGQDNIASGYMSTVGGGGGVIGNVASGNYSTISGGYGNLASEFYSTISGGQDNIANGRNSTVGGGQSNTASVENSTVGGGGGNIASGLGSTVGGGTSNITGGLGSTVAGGMLNIANGDYSFVAGRNANDGAKNNSFIWGGAGGVHTSFGVDTFNVWSAGGIYLNGAVQHASDRDMKEAYSFVSAREVLDKVVEIPVQSWRFKGEADSIRHIGPVAQDFMAAFGYGVDDTHITATDADGVALAAIQGLNAKVEETKAEQDQSITALRWQNAILRNKNLALEARLARLEKAILKEEI